MLSEKKHKVFVFNNWLCLKPRFIYPYTCDSETMGTKEMWLEVSWWRRATSVPYGTCLVSIRDLRVPKVRGTSTVFCPRIQVVSRGFRG